VHAHMHTHARGRVASTPQYFCANFVFDEDLVQVDNFILKTDVWTPYPIAVLGLSHNFKMVYKSGLAFGKMKLVVLG